MYQLKRRAPHRGTPNRAACSTSSPTCTPASSAREPGLADGSGCFGRAGKSKEKMREARKNGRGLGGGGGRRGAWAV